MAFDDHKNFAYSLVATAPSPADTGTSLVVTAGQGTRFPAVSFNATVWPASTQPLPTNAEIVRVTAIATDTFTITRAQEGSTARSIVVGDQIAATITDKVLTDAELTIQDEAVDLTTRNILNFVGPAVIADDNASKTRVRVMDPITMAFASDEFLTGATTTGAIGSLGWTSGGGTTTPIGNVAGRPGILRRETGTTINTFAGIRNTATIVPADTFDLTFIFRLNQTDADTTLRIGLLSSITAAPGDGIYLEKLGADTNWFYITNAAAETRTDSGVAADTGWHRLRIRRKDASTIAFSLDGGAETDVTANIPTAELFWAWHITNAAAANKTVDLDYTHLLITGLSR